LQARSMSRNGDRAIVRHGYSADPPCVALATLTCPYQLECLDIPPEEVVVAGPELPKEKVKQKQFLAFA